jgi:hypothetical protein
MFTERRYQSQADMALEMAQKSQVRHVRRGYIKLHVYWSRLALAAERRELDQRVPDFFARDMHRQTVRKYRLELTAAPPGLARAKLITLLARMKMAAAERGWPETV